MFAYQGSSCRSTPATMLPSQSAIVVRPGGRITSRWEMKYRWFGVPVVSLRSSSCVRSPSRWKLGVPIVTAK